MMLVKYLMILISCISFSLCWSNKISMIVDVVKSYDRPTAVVAKTCWKTSEKRHLMTALMSTRNARTLRFANNFKAIEKCNPKDVIIVLDLNCGDSITFLRQADKNKKFEKPHRWLILSKIIESNDDVPTELRNLIILLDSEVIVTKPIVGDTVSLKLVYRIDSSRDFITEPFGIWNASHGLNLDKNMEQAIIMRRKNLMGKQIATSVVTLDNRTKDDIFTLKNILIDPYAKGTINILLPLYSFMNATIALTFTDTWGYFINDTWSGMVGQIVRGDAELCGTITFMRLNRVDVLDFMTQPVPITVMFVFREPPLSFQNNLFILPFKSAVWMCIGALVLALIFIIYVNAKWETTKKNGKKSEDPSVLKPEVSDVTMLIVSAITQQGSNIGLKSSLGRTVTFIMFLMFLFLYVSYSANIVALLQSSSDQIQTLSDLLHSRLELGAEDLPYTRYYFSTATDPVKKAIYETKVARVGHKHNFMNVDEGVKKLQNIEKPFAFHMDVATGYRIVEQLFHEHEKCGLREIEYIPNSKPWVCCRKTSPYREFYKIGLARISEHGIADRVNRLIYASKPFCNMRAGSFGSVNMVDFHPVLMWLLYGMVASVLLLVLEILVYRRQSRYERS